MNYQLQSLLMEILASEGGVAQQLSCLSEQRLSRIASASKGSESAGHKKIEISRGAPSLTTMFQATASYALEGSIAVGGSGVRWLRDNLGAIKSAEDSEAIAASVPDSAGNSHFP